MVTAAVFAGGKKLNLKKAGVEIVSVPDIVETVEKGIHQGLQLRKNPNSSVLKILLTTTGASSPTEVVIANYAASGITKDHPQHVRALLNGSTGWCVLRCESSL
jgi:hypothetical protein